MVEAEQQAPGRRLVLHRDLDVRDAVAQLGRQRVESSLDDALELRSGAVRIAHFPRDVFFFSRDIFFFGFAFAGVALPAVAARASCFFVATSTSSARRTRTTDATPSRGC
jgi:hypothetical protein